MLKKPKKLSELDDLTIKQSQILEVCNGRPLSIKEIMFKADLSYNYVWEQSIRLSSKGYLVKVGLISGKSKYLTNNKAVKL